jgi:hypothetical protein
MEIITNGTAKFRTRLMDTQHAHSFAKALLANPRFESVEVHFSLKAKSPAQWFVSYRPASLERQRAILERQQDARLIRAIEQGSDYTWVPAEGYFYCVSTSGEVYETTAAECSCPDRVYRGRAAGVACKHSLALANGLGALVQVETIPLRQAA